MSDVQVLKAGVPIKLYGECGGCHAIVETDVKEARKLPGVANPLLKIDCPTCQYPISLMAKLTSGGVKYEQVVQLTRERNEWLRLLRIVREADGLSGRDAVDTVLAGSPEGFVQAERERLKR